VVGCFVYVGVERHGRDEIRDADGDDHANEARDEGQGEAFQEKLSEDVSTACAEGFEQADLAGALSDGHEHDIHDTDATDAEGHCSDDAEDELERGAELHDLLRVFDGVPGGDGFVVFGVEVVAVGENCSDSLNRFDVQVGRTGLEDNTAGVALVAEDAHCIEWDECVFVVGAVVGGVLDFGGQDADDLEDMPFDLDGFADGWVAVEELLRGMAAEDDDLTVFGEVGRLEVAAFGDVEFAHAAVGQFDGLAGDIDDLGAVLEAEAVVAFGADSGEEGNGIADGFDVSVEEFDFFAGTLAASLHAGLATPHHDDVVAEAEEAIENFFTDAATVAEKENYGDESPDDAEHGEAGTKAVAEQGIDALTDDFGEVHGYSVLRHSMGLRFAARSAG